MPAERRASCRYAAVLVAAFLLLNFVVIAVALAHLFTTPMVLGDWWTTLTTQHGNPIFAVAVALIVFPKLALGLSGFETGVAVMPQIRGDAGVLVLITSAAVAVTLSARRRRQCRATIGFGVVSVVFLFTTLANIIERPDGIKIAGFFIAGIIAVSLFSRVSRSTELRVTAVRFDPVAEAWITADTSPDIRLIAHEPNNLSAHRYQAKLRHARLAHRLPDDQALYIEVRGPDSSEFEGEVLVRGVERHGFRVLAVEASTVPNAIAAVTIQLHEQFSKTPHIYFRWTEGNPILNFLSFLVLGIGEIAPMTREILREAEPDVTKHPWVHVA